MLRATPHSMKCSIVRRRLSSSNIWSLYMQPPRQTTMCLHSLCVLSWSMLSPGILVVLYIWKIGLKENVPKLTTSPSCSVPNTQGRSQVAASPASQCPGSSTLQCAQCVRPLQPDWLVCPLLGRHVQLTNWSTTADGCTGRHIFPKRRKKLQLL